MLILTSISSCDDDHHSIPEQDTEHDVIEGPEVFCERAYGQICVKYFYDTNGFLIREQSDRDCDGTLDLNCLSYFHDFDGTLLSDDRDFDCDGVLDLCNAYDYDHENNRVIISPLKFFCPGTCAEHQLDERGNTIYTRSDLYCDGTVVTCTISTYDENSYFASFGIDNDCDGIADSDCYTYKHSTTGELLRTKPDSSCDGFFENEFCDLYDYNEQGEAVAQRSDGNCDGIPSGPSGSCRFFEYDDSDRLSELLDFVQCKGIPNTCVRYRYEIISAP
jgi:hypothetical protein